MNTSIELYYCVNSHLTNVDFVYGGEQGNSYGDGDGNWLGNGFGHGHGFGHSYESGYGDVSYN